MIILPHILAAGLTYFFVFALLVLMFLLFATISPTSSIIKHDYYIIKHLKREDKNAKKRKSGKNNISY